MKYRAKLRKQIRKRLKENFFSNAILSAQSEACGEIHDAKVLSSEKGERKQLVKIILHFSCASVCVFICRMKNFELF